MDGNLVIIEGSLFRDFFTPMDGSLIIMEGSLLRRVFVTAMDGSLFFMEGSLLSIFFLLQWMAALTLWKVVCCRDLCYSMDGSLVIMEGSMLSRFLLLQWMVTLTLWKVVCCRYFCYSNGWYPCHYGWLAVVEIFITLMDGTLIIMEGSMLSIFLLLQWNVSLSLWKVVCF